MRPSERRLRRHAFHALGGGEAFSRDARSERDALAGHLAEGGSLAGLDLAGRTLRGMDLRDADLRGSNLHGADLRGCDLGFARLDGCDLSGADLAGCYGVGASFSGATFGLDRGKPASLAGADLPGARLRDVRCEGTSFSEAVLERADMTGGTFVDASFRGARLGDAEHARGSYRGCDFAKADMRALAGPRRPGVTRADRTVDTLAVANRFEGAHLGDVVPSFARDKALSGLSKALAVGLAGAGVAGAVGLAGYASGPAAAMIGGSVDLASLADRLEATLHYRHLADMLAGTAPGQFVAAHSQAVVAALVSGAVLLKDKATGLVKDRLAGHVRAALDAARPLVADVARRCGNLGATVAAFVTSPRAAGLLVRGLAEAGGNGRRSPFRQACAGDTTVVVCTADRLGRAMEWLATSLGKGERPAHDVLLVRDAADMGPAPAAIRLDAGGGLTAFWRGADGITSRAWSAAEMADDPASPWGLLHLPDDGPDMARRRFENAMLRDRLPGLGVEYIAGRGHVEFAGDGRVVVTGTAPDGSRERYEGTLDEGPLPGPGR